MFVYMIMCLRPDAIFKLKIFNSRWSIFNCCKIYFYFSWAVRPKLQNKFWFWAPLIAQVLMGLSKHSLNVFFILTSTKISERNTVFHMTQICAIKKTLLWNKHHTLVIILELSNLTKIKFRKYLGANMNKGNLFFLLNFDLTSLDLWKYDKAAVVVQSLQWPPKYFGS